MRPRSTASSQPPTWAIVALVTLAHLALAWGLVHWTAAPNPTAPPALSVQWVAELTPLQATPAPPDKRPGPLPKALPKAAPVAQTPPTTPIPPTLPAVAPVVPPAIATTPAFTPATPTVAANSPPATGQPSPMAAPAPAPGPAAASNILGSTTTLGGVATGAPANANKSALANLATPPSFHAAYLRNPKPRYPKASSESGETGTVVLDVQVEPNGRASKVLVHKSSGYERLDTAAKEAVKQWQFVPAQEANQAVRGSVLVPIPFRLKQ